LTYCFIPHPSSFVFYGPDGLSRQWTWPEGPGRRGRRAAKAQAPEARGGISSVGALVEEFVKDRVRAVLDKAIACLRRARGL